MALNEAIAEPQLSGESYEDAQIRWWWALWASILFVGCWRGEGRNYTLVTWTLTLNPGWHFGRAQFLKAGHPWQPYDSHFRWAIYHDRSIHWGVTFWHKRLMLLFHLIHLSSPSKTWRQLISPRGIVGHSTMGSRARYPTHVKTLIIVSTVLETTIVLSEIVPSLSHSPISLIWPVLQFRIQGNQQHP